MQKNRARLLISCPDRPGIVSAVGKLLYEQGMNILQSDQFSTLDADKLFFMRIEFECLAGEIKKASIEQEFEKIASEFQMDWRIELANTKKRIAIFVSREDHCLHELLWEWQTGHLFADIRMVISNHEDARQLVESLHIPYHYIPVTRDTKGDSEAKQLRILEGNTDVIVLARYMQILSPEFLRRYSNRIINIHHSFLPAFIGRNPYQRAYDRGVKLIGATAHYVTEDLDEGPIIEQQVERVDHRYDAEALKDIGRLVERSALLRAVKWHVEDRILVHKNRTIVFA
jgi:formyltetrahydrofolate deformylase